MKSGGKKRKCLRVFGRFFIFFGLFIITALAGFDLWIKPTLNRMAEYQCKRIAERAVSGAVCLHTNEAEEDCVELINLVYDENGNIRALRTNPARINRLKAMLTECINKELASVQPEEIGISLGTLTGIGYLYGSGAELTFSVKPMGIAETRLLSAFKSAGINQTVHSITLEVTTDISPLIPGFTEEISVKTEFVIAQTIIVGEVPDTFSNIILDEQHFSELAEFNLTG